MIPKFLMLNCVALTAIVLQSTQTTTCTTRCLECSTKAVTCMGNCTAIQQTCSGHNVLGGDVQWEAGPQSTISTCSNGGSLCAINPCRTCSLGMCGIMSNDRGAPLNCGPCSCPRICNRTLKFCRHNSDCNGDGGARQGTGSASGSGGPDT